MKSTRERVFGKRPDLSINALDWMEDEDVLAITTRSQNQINSDFNRNVSRNQPINNFARNTSNFRNNFNNQQFTFADLISKYNIVEDLAKVKVDSTLIDLARVPEQHKNLENCLASSLVNKSVNKPVHTATSNNVDKPSAYNLINDENFLDDRYETLTSVQNPYSPKNPPFYVSMKIMDKISHCCLIDGGSRPNMILKKIMEELGLSCTNDNPRNMLAFNKQRQSTIGEIKDVTLVMFSHPKIRTACSLQVTDMSFNNYSIILGRDWQALTRGYYSMDGSHIIILKGSKNIIIYQEERLVPYIENPPQPNVNYVETDVGVYSIFDEGEVEHSEHKPIVSPNNDIW